MDANDDGMCFPQDVFDEILRRLPAGALAECRSVCPAWRAVVDDRNLLFPHFFPPSAFPGVFTSNFGCEAESHFLAPPPSRSAPPCDGPEFRRPPFRHDWANVKRHCNGLLLLADTLDIGAYVCNPATARCAPLPRPPKRRPHCFSNDMFLAFDPAVWRHHEVFFFHQQFAQVEEEEGGEPAILGLLFDEEEEPQPFMVPLLAFSSRSSQWERREFVPGSCAPTHLYNMVAKQRQWDWHGEYWRGSLYVDCNNGVLMVLHCSEGTYDMVLLPGGAKARNADKDRDEKLPERCLLATYDKGIYYAAFSGVQLQIWALIKSTDNGDLGWVISHESSLSPYCADAIWDAQEAIPSNMQWKLLDGKCKELASLFKPSGNDDPEGDDSEDEEVEESEEDQEEVEESEEEVEETEDDDTDDDDGSEHSWNSDEHNFVPVDQEAEPSFLDRFYIIGQHPHKDVLLLEFRGHVLAYHLGSLRMQYLCYRLSRDPVQQGHGVEGAFPYRPCYVDAIPTGKMPTSPYCL